MKGPVAPVPGRVRRDHRVLQPARGQERAEARRADARRHLLGQDQDLERLRDQDAEPRAEPARARRSRSCTGRTPRAPPTASRRTCRTSARRGRRRSAPARTSKWPVGTGAAKNSGVAAAVKQTTGAVGYVEQAYALENGFTYAAVKNSAGTYILPTISNTSAAADGITVPADLGISTINSPNAAGATRSSRRRSWSPTRTRARRAAPARRSAERAEEVLHLRVRRLASRRSGAGSSQLPYAPLPSSLAAKDNAQLAKMTCNGSPIS